MAENSGRCVPAGIVGLLFDEQIDALFYNYTTVAIMLILVGIAFIIIENYNKKRHPKIVRSDQITYKIALIIGVFQLIAVFRGHQDQVQLYSAVF